MAFDYKHNYVKAPKNGTGVIVHIPKGILSQLPNGDAFVEAVENGDGLEAKRYASSNRNHVQLSLRVSDDA